MKYEVKNYDYLIGIEGFSEQLLKNHFSLYQGYVNNTNRIIEQSWAIMDEEKIQSVEFAELLRRLGWEFDGMRTHEYYFENLKKGGEKIDGQTAIFKKIFEDFGSYDNWEKEFRAIGSMRGIGWAILYYDRQANVLRNVWINEHNENHLIGCAPLLVMDVWEHAYMIDYGTKKTGYISAFFNAIDWERVSTRFNETNW